ncbi:hypothetical protein ABT279_39560, partial [Amycolatopsis sp. NPDC000673]|uniref:hypothetical protein n=1 Tax=Amycolatopsis sp. NPDC000673 TaxID=3154267 RepID=UPI00332FD161
MLHHNLLGRALAPTARSRGGEHPQPNQLTPHPRRLETPNDGLRINRQRPHSAGLPPAPGASQIRAHAPHRQLPH